MLSFWNETLKNISQDQRKDKFRFIINKIIYEVPLSYALGISPFITEQYLKDPTFRKLKIDDKEKLEEEFSNFIRGKAIPKEIFIKLGKLLKNKEMVAKWKNSNPITKETVIENIKSIREIYYQNNENNFLNINPEKETNYFEEIKDEIEYIENNLKEM